MTLDLRELTNEELLRIVFRAGIDSVAAADELLRRLSVIPELEWERDEAKHDLLKMHDWGGDWKLRALAAESARDRLIETMKRVDAENEGCPHCECGSIARAALADTEAQR